MTIDTTEQPVSHGADLEDPFELDITFIESGPDADTVIAMTDDGCGSTCPSACTTSTG